MNKQAILDVLNSLEVVEQEGGDSAFILVDNNVGNREKLNAVGVEDSIIHACGDEETFCILALAFNEGYADDYEDGKLVIWGPIDDDLRYRVANGEGKSSDAERLLRENLSLLTGIDSKKEEIRKFVWGKCLLLTTEKQTQFNKGKRAVYEEIWNELGGDINSTAQEGG